VQQKRRRKVWLKYDRSPKPTSKATAVMLRSAKRGLLRTGTPARAVRPARTRRVADASSWRQMVSRGETAAKLLDAGQDGFLIARESPVIGAVELDESRQRDVAGEMPAGANANGAVAATVEHQGRRANSVQKVPHVRITQRLQRALEGSRAGRSPEQACPPGSRLRIARQARRERLDAGRPAPDRDELLQPHVILTGLQRMRIVGCRASLRQR